MSTKEQYWKYSLIVIILFMGVIIFRQITPFLGGLLGALTIYILVRGQMNHLVEKRKLKRSISALLITAETIFVFLIPLGLTVWMVANKLQDINLDPQTYIAPIQQVAEFIKEKTGYDVLGKDTLSFIMSILPRIGQIIMESISSLAINLFVMIFVLYFMLIGGKKMEAYVNDILPFNETNTQEVIHEINMIVRSNAIGIPLLAIIQGGVAMIGYLLFGAPNILMLGFLTCFATIIPMVGTALVWFPVAAYLAISGDWFNAIGLFGYGAIVVSQSDNLIRFILQKKMADTHPLITIFGVVIGLPIFGFMGVIFGPLLLSLFFLFVDMFKKEYLDLRNNLHRDDETTEKLCTFAAVKTTLNLMETFTFNTVELILLSVAGILFIIQLIYYFGLYNRIHVHNKAVGKEEVHFIRELPPLSVILCARNEAENLRKILPAILEQDYPQFE